MGKFLQEIAAFFLSIHKAAATSGLENEAIDTIKTTAEKALSHINTHSNNLVDDALEAAASTTEAAISAHTK